MIIVQPSYEILTDIDKEKIFKNIEIAGRVCYKSEDKITPESSDDFVKKIVKRDHLSVIEHEKITVRFIFSRGSSHELVRHRLASYSQESTRFCNYSKDKFGKEITVVDQRIYMKNELQRQWWLTAMTHAENGYMNLLDELVPPQIARSVLPIGLKTEIVITANLRHWKEIFKQRCAEEAQPEIRNIMRKVHYEFSSKLPYIFGDLIGD